MKRIAPTVLFALALAAGPAATVGADTPRASLRSPLCVTAMDPVSRAISITAVMRPLTGTMRMQLKFDLLRRTAIARPFTRVRGGDLSTWVNPTDPTLGQHPNDRWNLIKQVVDLKAPATYRFRVSFRWLGAHGRVLGTATRTSPTCYQPELRPDLQVRAIDVEAVAGRPDVNAYVAVIRNAGASAAGPFEVQFSDGDVLKTRTVSELAPHSSIKEQFIGPLCTAGAATLTADPTNLVDDLNRANNSLNVVCSASSRSGSHQRIVRSR
jgi:CARDB protein